VLGAGSIVAGLVSGPMIRRFGELGLVLMGLVDAAAGSLLRATGTIVWAVAGSRPPCCCCCCSRRCRSCSLRAPG